MIEVLDADQMRNIDRRTIEELGIPSSVLMENAGGATVEAIRESFTDPGEVVIACGKGNNGGDGFVIARLLHEEGVAVTILALAGVEDLEGDARLNAQLCKKMNISWIDVADDLPEQARDALDEADLIVDAIFGTGLSRAAEGGAKRLIEAVNEASSPVVAVDVPSGLNASTASLIGAHVKASLTVTFCRPKVCMVLAPASSACGEVAVADISIPDQAVEEEEVSLFLSSPDLVVDVYPDRKPEWHKGDSGRIGIVAGSAGRSGAALLSVRGALRGGAGLITLVSDRETTRIVDGSSAESMSKPVGMKSADEIVEAIDGSDVVVLGPGLADDQHELILEVIPRIEAPLVIDATALNALASSLDVLDSRKGQTTVLTPHPGEMGRLVGATAADVQKDRLERAGTLAAERGVIVVLKGYQTIIASPDGRAVVNPTGNPAMATGGVGDVLSGLIGAWLAQTEDPFEAVAAVVWLHGFAGDLLAEQTGPGITAGDLAESIPVALASVRGIVGSSYGLPSF